MSEEDGFDGAPYLPGNAVILEYIKPATSSMISRAPILHSQLLSPDRHAKGILSFRGLTADLLGTGVLFSATCYGEISRTIVGQYALLRSTYIAYPVAGHSYPTVTSWATLSGCAWRVQLAAVAERSLLFAGYGCFKGNRMWSSWDEFIVDWAEMKGGEWLGVQIPALSCKRLEEVRTQLWWNMTTGKTGQVVP